MNDRQMASALFIALPALGANDLSGGVALAGIGALLSLLSLTLARATHNWPSSQVDTFRVIVMAGIAALADVLLRAIDWSTYEVVHPWLPLIAVCHLTAATLQNTLPKQGRPVVVALVSASAAVIPPLAIGGLREVGAAQWLLPGCIVVLAALLLAACNHWRPRQAPPNGDSRPRRVRVTGPVS